MTGLERLRARVVALFPERHLYIRSGGEMRAYVLAPKKQMAVAGVVTAAALWMGVSTAAMLLSLVQRSGGPEAAVAASDGAAALAALVERRHAALALILAEAKSTPGAAQALTPAFDRVRLSETTGGTPTARLQSVARSQDEVLDAADRFAANRSERLRRAIALTGLPAHPAVAGGIGGPLIAADDPRALSAALGVDAAFARRVQAAAQQLSAAEALDARAQQLPLARPTRAPAQSSGFGLRLDPFTGRPAFHPGLDFPGVRMTPVFATAPGTVSFTGVRSGYGQVVEVEHGGGVKTRYAHLARIGVRAGQQVAAGATVGGMGSTGRSTGTHLHYEVWVNGRAQNPERFVRAGAYVRQQAG